MKPWDESQPIYRQVRDHVIAEILDGRLMEEQAVPSIRQFAANAAINPLTVTRAYQELVDMGVLEKRRGVGMFVAPLATVTLLAQERRRFLQDEWPALQARLERLGLAHLLSQECSPQR